MFLTLSYFVVTIFAISSAWNNKEEYFQCGESFLPSMNQDDVAQFYQSSYTTESTDTLDYRPFNIHFVMPPVSQISIQMRLTIEAATAWGNNRLSNVLKAPALPEIRRARQWNASRGGCDRSLCLLRYVPGEYSLPCRDPITKRIIPEPDVPINVNEDVHRLNAANNITLVIYVATANSSQFVAALCSKRGLFAFAGSCQWDPHTNRPTHGMLGLCIRPDEMRGEKAARIVLHEIMHIVTDSVVGWGSKALGCPQPKADRYSILRCENITYKKVERPRMLPNGTYVNQTRLITITPNVKKAAQEYFRCEQVEGVEVGSRTTTEDDSAASNWTVPPGTVMPSEMHWSEPLFPDEVLVTSEFGALRLSSVALGLLKDLGWYEVDMSKAEPMEATRPPPGDGCTVALKNCQEIITKRRALHTKQVSPNMGPYCDKEYDLKDRVITSLCFNDMEPLQCFDLGASLDCGYVQRPVYYDSLACNETGIFSKRYPPEIGATVGPGTICLSVGPIYMQRYNDTITVGICVQYDCDHAMELLTLTLKPYGNGTCQVICPASMSNKLLTVTFTFDEQCKRHLGESVPVICPTYDRVCPTTASSVSPAPHPTPTSQHTAAVHERTSQSKAPKLENDIIGYIMIVAPIATVIKLFQV